MAPTPNPAPNQKPKTSTPSKSAPVPHAPSTAQAPTAPSRSAKPAKRFHAAQWGAIGAIVLAVIALVIIGNIQTAENEDQPASSSSSTEQEASSSDSGGGEGSSTDSSGSGDDTSDGSDSGDSSSDSQGASDAGSTTFEPTAVASAESEVDRSGVRQRITFKSTSWMLGSDTAKLNAAWKSVGGEGDFPITDESLNGAKLANSVVLVGTVEYENLTPGFSTEDTFGGSLFGGKLSVTLKDGAKGADGTALDYSNRTSVFQTSNNGITFPDQTGHFPDPNMGDKTHWGPVPFAYALGDYKTPRYPDGDPTLDSVEVTIVPYSITGRDDEDVVLPVKKGW